jgi:CubicO group peptidase (beta-lactamase class C family)
MHPRGSDARTLYAGVSVAVIENFEVAWARGFGVRRMGESAAVQPDTPFQTGSISKAVFALPVMRLCQDKRIDLDADIRTYLKSWQIPAGDDGWGPTINLRQLLSHTAGTTVHGFPGYPAGGTWPSLAQILDASLQPTRRPSSLTSFRACNSVIPAVLPPSLSWL